MAKITVLYVQPGLPPKSRTIEDSLKELQGLVKGRLELLSFGDIDIFINEEGLLLDLPINRIITGKAPEVPEGFVVVKTDPDLADPGEEGEFRINGDFFVCRHDEEGNNTSLTPEDIDRLTKVFSKLVISSADLETI
jgi:hypothetical protein